MIRVLRLGVLALVLIVVVACGASPSAHRPSHHSPASAPRTGSPPASTAPAPAPTPTPATSPTSLIPQHDQQLTLTGAVSGTVSTAEVKECGAGNGQWAMELSSMTVQGGTASLTLLVSSYNGAGSYQPTGALNAIMSQQLTTYSVQSGAVNIAGSGSSGQMNLTLASSAGQNVQVQGTWACG